MGVGIKLTGWSIVAHIGRGAVVLASHKVVSWNQALCQVKKIHAKKLDAFIGYNVRGNWIRKTTDPRNMPITQIHKWKKVTAEK